MRILARRHKRQEVMIERKFHALITCSDPKGLFKNWKRVGEGSFGQVFLAEEQQSGDSVAVKRVRLQTGTRKGRLRQLYREVATLSECHHVNIVALDCTYLFDKHVWMVMEFCDGGPLSKLLEETELKEVELLYIAREILQGLAFLHKCGHIHRDIKSENILLNLNGEVKIGDFGLCTPIPEQGQFLYKTCGSRFWMSPEMVLKRGYSKGTDVWSLGCVLWEMATGSPPFYSVSPFQGVFAKVTHGVDVKFSKFSSIVSDFIQKMLTWDRVCRPSAAELLHHKALSTKVATKKTIAALFASAFVGNVLREAFTF
eukprot:TRINITY_DN2698_c0_g1_i1.p1 TRINITY_DN2698_c0_g1~~TRINITY_DN2698_c0_g1_i1.p1  ORF type:complete len:314 (-),score=54.37 TRINITY_DN2698_c0_g1_i1:1385-2326(-)